MKPTFALPTLLAAALASVGCQSPNAVVFVTTTGINVEASAAEGTQSTAHVGYTRFEGVLMPGRNPDGSPRQKAYPVLSKMDFSSGSLFLPSFSVASTGATAPMRLHQVFATGKAATGRNSVDSIKRDFQALSGQLAEHRTSQATARKFFAEANEAKLREAWALAVETGLIEGAAPELPANADDLKEDLNDALVGNDEIRRAKLALFLKHLKIQ